MPRLTRERPPETRATDRNRLGQPEDERGRVKVGWRVKPKAKRGIERAAERAGCTVGELLERWEAAGCPLTE